MYHSNILHEIVSRLIASYKFKKIGKQLRVSLENSKVGKLLTRKFVTWSWVTVSGRPTSLLHLSVKWEDWTLRPLVTSHSH